MKIYFSGSISGGRGRQALYARIIGALRPMGQVLTEHIGDPSLGVEGESNRDDRFIHDRDMAWIREADAVVAEVSTPSLGVGYEIARAAEMGKPVLCLRDAAAGRLSAMIAGCPGVTLRQYESEEEAIRGAVDFAVLLSC